MKRTIIKRANYQLKNFINFDSAHEPQKPSIMFLIGFIFIAYLSFRLVTKS